MLKVESRYDEAAVDLINNACTTCSLVIINNNVYGTFALTSLFRS